MSLMQFLLDVLIRNLMYWLHLVRLLTCYVVLVSVYSECRNFRPGLRVYGTGFPFCYLVWCSVLRLWRHLAWVKVQVARLFRGARVSSDFLVSSVYISGEEGRCVMTLRNVFLLCVMTLVSVGLLVRSALVGGAVTSRACVLPVTGASATGVGP